MKVQSNTNNQQNLTNDQTNKSNQSSANKSSQFNNHAQRAKNKSASLGNAQQPGLDKANSNLKEDSNNVIQQDADRKSHSNSNGSSQSASNVTKSQSNQPSESATNTVNSKSAVSESSGGFFLAGNRNNQAPGNRDNQAPGNNSQQRPGNRDNQAPGNNSQQRPGNPTQQFAGNNNPPLGRGNFEQQRPGNATDRPRSIDIFDADVKSNGKFRVGDKIFYTEDASFRIVSQRKFRPAEIDFIVSQTDRVANEFNNLPGPNGASKNAKDPVNNEQFRRTLEKTTINFLESYNRNYSLKPSLAGFVTPNHGNNIFIDKNLIEIGNIQFVPAKNPESGILFHEAVHIGQVFGGVEISDNTPEGARAKPLSNNRHISDQERRLPFQQLGPEDQAALVSETTVPFAVSSGRGLPPEPPQFREFERGFDLDK